ncbi:hypothetical protein O3299_07390 [Janthinobacterium sp. SUN176]|uniref:hypothetical protein n=1 Tax=Janthinobacterium sp. SUN176 TaxID=3014788 RepID=UPI0027143801|nr:hypothetical protein [Janthinobacterium sp. SUN176]MDO8071345.1 hypothetical protein [Janthinobacterium sp. SUN176]
MEASSNERDSSQREVDFNVQMELYIKRKLRLLAAQIGILTFFLGTLGVMGIGYKDIIFTPLIKYIYPPSVIREELLKLSADANSKESTALKTNVLDFLHDHVDSGYTKVMILPARGKFNDNNIPFYSTPEQEVELTIYVDTEQLDFRYVATVDQKPIDDDGGSDHSIPMSRPVLNISLAQKLNFDQFSKNKRLPNLHLLSISPTDVQKKDVIITCVIIVRNKKMRQQ